jgi:toxin ParE1/3/4
MTLPLVFRPVAREEFDRAAAWNDEQRRGLGDEFVAAVQLVLDKISNHPNRYFLADADVREVPVSRFPYCVYYRVKPGRVVVVAVFHTSRDPSILRGRH